MRSKHKFVKLTSIFGISIISTMIICRLLDLIVKGFNKEMSKYNDYVINPEQHEQYNDVIVEGRQILSLQWLLRDKGVAIVLVNDKPNLGVSRTVHRLAYVHERDIGLLKDNVFDVRWTGINVGAVLRGANSNYEITLVDSTIGTLTYCEFKDLHISGLHQIDEMRFYIGELEYDREGHLQKSKKHLESNSNDAWTNVEPESKYMSRLIRDTYGKVIGYCFVQIRDNTLRNGDTL